MYNGGVDVLPLPAIIVLIGPAGSGKSTWAAQLHGPHAVVSSDALRALVGESEADMAASGDAFALLDLAVERRAARRLTTVVDTLGFDADRRARIRELASRHRLPCIALCFDTPKAVCRARNRARPRVVPAAVIEQQFATYAGLRNGIEHEGFDRVIVAGTEARLAQQPIADTRPLAAAQRDDPTALRFGLQIPMYTWPGGPGEIGERLRRVAQAAEDAGFNSLWVMDHMRQIPMFGPPWLDMLESFSVLNHLAAVTTRIRLGPMVAGITHRHPALLGKTVATLDVLSGGRAICGLGAAWYADEHSAYGWPMPPLRERYELLEDTLQFLPSFWGPGGRAFVGRRLNVPEAACYPRPLQAKIPLLVGGSGESQTLRLVAKYADACNLIGEAAFIRKKLAVLHSQCEREQRDRATIEVTQLSTTLTARDAAELDRLIARVKPPRLAASKFLEQSNAGTVDDQIGRFRGLADAGIQTAIVSLPDLDGTPAAVERFAPIIAAFR